TAITTATGTDIAADKMIGREVVDSAGKKIGKVESALIGQDGKVRYVIVGVGGFLGIGERDVALRWDQLSFAGNSQKIVVNMTKDELAALPPRRFAEPAQRGKVYAYDEDVKTNAYLAEGTQPATTQAAAAATTPGAVDMKKLIGKSLTTPSNDNV